MPWYDAPTALTDAVRQNYGAHPVLVPIIAAAHLEYPYLLHGLLHGGRELGGEVNEHMERSAPLRKLLKRHLRLPPSRAGRILVQLHEVRTPLQLDEELFDAVEGDWQAICLEVGRKLTNGGAGRHEKHLAPSDGQLELIFEESKSHRNRSAASIGEQGDRQWLIRERARARGGGGRGDAVAAAKGRVGARSLRNLGHLPH